MIQAKKIKKTMIRETLESLEAGEFVQFTPTEVEGQSIRTVASRVNKTGKLLKTEKTINGYKVTRLA